MYRWAIVVSVVFFVAACASPALVFEKHARGASQGPDEMTGVELLMIGWLGPFALQFAWFANPLLALSLWALATRRPKRATVFAGLSILLSLQTFGLFWQAVPADEGGVGELRLQHFGPGFFVWQAAILAALVGAILSRPLAPAGKDLLAVETGQPG